MGSAGDNDEKCHRITSDECAGGEVEQCVGIGLTEDGSHCRYGAARCRDRTSECDEECHIFLSLGVMLP